MSTFSNLIARGNSAVGRREVGDTNTIIDLMVTFLGIAFFALVLVALLVVLRRARHQRRQREQTLPQYNDIKHDDDHNTRRLTIQTGDCRQSILVVNGRPMLADPASPPHSPTNIPEIHITFPDEHDEHGRQKNGRVLIVRVGEKSVGLEPLQDEQLPAYEKESKGGFYSIDMDHIGGLKEKDRSQFA
ncbi:Uu.00g082200.m01.CDS01 [Anthostomella pinea]|uniref:Uu.00g082200.m01.CDS01 n=1 Tax=Anthostomella pinea TaxID=933095 RepID=A0AAI8YH33_9PEZI|nr:Uu.00g082200.m01.CDS01 [Anthostomella pinea]